MALLTKDQIKQADKKKFVDVPVKEWGGEVRLQEMSASERDLWESENVTTVISDSDDDGQQKVTSKWNPKHVRARLVVRCMVDADGRRMYSDDEVAVVGSLSASTVEKLFKAANKLNAITAKDIEELEKNSDAAPSGASSSDSASSSA
jgi:Phage tail assembly chaperone